MTLQQHTTPPAFLFAGGPKHRVMKKTLLTPHHVAQMEGMQPCKCPALQSEHQAFQNKYFLVYFCNGRIGVISHDTKKHRTNIETLEGLQRLERIHKMMDENER